MADKSLLECESNSTGVQNSLKRLPPDLSVSDQQLETQRSELSAKRLELMKLKNQFEGKLEDKKQVE